MLLASPLGMLRKFAHRNNIDIRVRGRDLYGFGTILVFTMPYIGFYVFASEANHISAFFP